MQTRLRALAVFTLAAALVGPAQANIPTGTWTVSRDVGSNACYDLSEHGSTPSGNGGFSCSWCVPAQHVCIWIACDAHACSVISMPMARARDAARMPRSNMEPPRAR